MLHNSIVVNNCCLGIPKKINNEAVLTFYDVFDDCMITRGCMFVKRCFSVRVIEQWTFRMCTRLTNKN